MSMSNNIAEGSGSNSKNEFKQFLNIARRSIPTCRDEHSHTFEPEEIYRRKRIKFSIRTVRYFMQKDN